RLRPLAQHVEDAVAPAVGGDLDGLEPVVVHVAEEVVLRADRGVDRSAQLGRPGAHEAFFLPPGIRPEVPLAALSALIRTLTTTRSPRAVRMSRPWRRAGMNTTAITAMDNASVRRSPTMMAVMPSCCYARAGVLNSTRRVRPTAAPRGVAPRAAAGSRAS